jgi:hypothetical protein
MARRDPVRWLNSVDLPTFGRPTMATSGDSFFLLKVIELRAIESPRAASAGSLVARGS